MTARSRGEHDMRSGTGRPGSARSVTLPEPRPPQPGRAAMPPADGRAPRRRWPWWLPAVAATAAIGCLALTGWFSPGPVRSMLPASPRAWLDAYEAAAIDNPSRVCSQLFAPALAEAYATAMHGSCTRYFEQITSYSVAVRRVLEDRGTAVLELRQTVRPRDWAVVLSRGPAGWRAVDLLPGALVR
jgi:hypothetical protein